MFIRGEKDLMGAARMDKKQEVNNMKRPEGQEAAGDEFFSSSLPSPSTTSQVRMSYRTVYTSRQHDLSI